MCYLLALGDSLLSSYVDQQGDGDVGPEVTTSEGDTARRLPERHGRRYVSIFGELIISRVVYGTREGQKIERVPLDERLGLPEGDFSYVLEDWGQRLCLKESFVEAGQSLAMLLGLRLGTRALEKMNRAVSLLRPVVPGLTGATPGVSVGRLFPCPSFLTGRSCRPKAHASTVVHPPNGSSARWVPGLALFVQVGPCAPPGLARGLERGLSGISRKAYVSF
jgi:hypothetical protein